MLLRLVLLSTLSVGAIPSTEGPLLHYVQSGGSGGTGGNATTNPTINCNVAGACPQYNIGGTGGDGGSVKTGGPRPGNNDNGDAASSGGNSCRELWHARNEIFARAGYCFKTNDAIAAFGKGCFPPYGRLNGPDKARVDEIKRLEREKGC